MTPTIKQYISNLSDESIEMMLEDLHEAYISSTEQWEGFCEECKVGFDSYSEWERKDVEKGTQMRRQYFFLKKEVDYKNWDEFTNFLIEEGCLNK